MLTIFNKTAQIFQNGQNSTSICESRAGHEKKLRLVVSGDKLKYFQVSCAVDPVSHTESLIRHKWTGIAYKSFDFQNIKVHKKDR